MDAHHRLTRASTSPATQPWVPASRHNNLKRLSIFLGCKATSSEGSLSSTNLTRLNKSPIGNRLYETLSAFARMTVPVTFTSDNNMAVQTLWLLQLCLTVWANKWSLTTRMHSSPFLRLCANIHFSKGRLIIRVPV